MSGLTHHATVAAALAAVPAAALPTGLNLSPPNRRFTQSAASPPPHAPRPKPGRRRPLEDDPPAELSANPACRRLDFGGRSPGMLAFG